MYHKGILIDLIKMRMKTICLNLNWCVMCRKDNESTDHLFLSCSTASFLWNKTNSILRRAYVFENLNNLIDFILNHNTKTKNQKGVDFFQSLCGHHLVHLAGKK